LPTEDLAVLGGCWPGDWSKLAVRRSKFVESRGRVGVEALADRNRQIPAEASTPECFSDRLLG